MQQRALLTETAVGAGKYVDDVILGAPVTVTKNLCTTMNITVVASGSKHTNMKLQASSDHYAVPKELGMFTTVESGHSMTTATIRERCAAVPLSGSQCRGLWATVPCVCLHASQEVPRRAPDHAPSSRVCISLG